ncbi:MAG: DUF4230 domain-containing protein [Prevotella sp.]|nr:DUF4230 domain-containing protein [Prevotella sp.]
MEQPQNNFQYFFCGLTKTVWVVIAAVLVAAITIVGALLYLASGNTIGITQQGSTKLSPTQVKAIQDIGQWEFLAISNEELIDTVRYGFFGDDELARIYYGTLRLGIDMSKANAEKMTVKGDSISIKLPPIELLDENFIDEARTQSFYESGRWSNADREKLYQRAVNSMKQRCLTPANMQAAEQNARLQIGKLLQGMGFKKTYIVFEE